MVVALLSLASCGGGIETVYFDNVESEPNMAEIEVFEENLEKEEPYYVEVDDILGIAPTQGAYLTEKSEATEILESFGLSVVSEFCEVSALSKDICECALCQYARKRIGVTPANVRIRFVANAHIQPEWDTLNEFIDISQISEHHTFAEQGNPFMKTLFTTDSVVTEFQFLSIGYCFWLCEPCCNAAIYICDVLFSLDELAPGKPLLVEWRYMGCFTSSRGVSFVYDGVRRYFEIIYSNYNGHLFLAERNVI